MLAKTNRLTKKKDFNLVFQKGKSVRGEFLECKALKNNLQEVRFGFIISKKVSPKATIRNKIKRRLRAVALGELETIKNPTDIIVIALPGAQKKEFLEMKQALSRLLSKLSIA